jgi:Raf kinase inhibitor-like YbhB/YbcL family protein
VLCLALALAGTACSQERAAIETKRTIAVASRAFADGAALPRAHTCDGGNASPPLRWDAVEGADGYAITMVDLDADDFVHWVVFDIPATLTELAGGAIPSGAAEGRNDFGREGYSGPCPPTGDDAHRYVFTIYAVSGSPMRGLEPGASLARVLDAIDCCVEAGGTITARYRRA